MRIPPFLRHAPVITLLVILFAPPAAPAGPTGTVRGRITDRTSRDPLPGAIVQVAGTGLGTSTDLDGRYALPSIPAGEITLTISYVGYDRLSLRVTVPENGVVDANGAMTAHAVEGETVIVTAQARGQMEAINQQLASNSIVNIVSTEKMKELPDANLAESIGRLPGISLQRDAGEAYAVVIRGLSPKYNQVTVEGIPMASTNYYDRTIDLSLLSDDLVRGVEVSKSLRPDMDADALGGTVNLMLRSAEHGLRYGGSAEGAYTDLRKTYNNYKFTASVSDRFADDRLGVLVQGNIEQKQLPSDHFSGSYSPPTFGSSTGTWFVNTSTAQLTDLTQIRHRLGGSAIVDYSTDLVDMKLFNMYDQKRDSTITRINTTTFYNNSFGAQVIVSDTKTEQETHALQALFKPWGIEIPVSLAYTKSDQHQPGTEEFDFWQQSSPRMLSPAQLIYGQPSDLIAALGVMDPSVSTMATPYTSNANLVDEEYDCKADVKVPFALSDEFSGTLSAGGKYHGVRRTSDADRIFFDIQTGNEIDRQKLINAVPWLGGASPYNQYGIDAIYFVDPGYTRTSILGYPVGPGYDVDKLTSMMHAIYAAYAPLFFTDGPSSFNQNYSDREHTDAAYVMGEIALGTALTIVPGVRYQDEVTDIAAYHIQLNGSNQNGLAGQAPVLAQSHRNTPAWYPSVNVKYRITEDIQAVGAAYRSMSLPSFGEISPLIEYNLGGPVTTGNPLLRPSKAWNFDLGASISGNDIGLLTVNLFYKEIADLIYAMQNFYPFYPYPIAGAPTDIFDRLPGPASGYFDRSWAAATNGLAISTSIPMNDPDRAYLRGIELSWQTHLWYLPGVLGGLVLDLNASYMSSRQFYPSFTLVKVGGTPIRPVYNLVYQTAASPLQDQPAATYNAIIGWDYLGFSSRFSLRFQQRTVTGIDTQYGLENAYYGNATLVDISLKQKVVDALSVFASATNIGAHIDNYYFSHPGYATYPGGDLPTNNETYGWAAHLGLTYAY
ncbi:MAG TPA: TonB-dependent receptor [Bacteroidota bacterium]|nr:TonB-dependent receptor [Bacteroidota bacterium]